MKFNSIVFVEFAVLFFFGWSLIGQRKPLALWFMVIASWVFYGFATWWFVPLLVGTATVDWSMALAIERWPVYKKAFAVASCVTNLGILALFKYSGFFADCLNGALRLQIAPPKILLPIGISFYTFQSLSYVFDVYRGKTAPAKSWLEFLAIVSLFAHLIAGPIVRVSKILPQIRELRKPTSEDVWSGLELICIGFFKKVVLADRLAVFVDLVYGESKPSSMAAILATMAFGFQIYYDFSGYTDIARGLARWLGLDFGINFNHPYRSIGLEDFWTRWHISLSSWVKDYLYIPLGGNREGAWKTHRNLWISMVLAGLWHGANWTFVIWGVLHAVFLSVEKVTEWPRHVNVNRTGRVIGAAITFALVCLGWVFFRSETLARALQMLSAMAHPFASGSDKMPADHLALLILLCGLVYEWNVFYIRREAVLYWAATDKMIAVRNAIMLALCIVVPSPPRAFIYFQF